jgi:integrase
MTGMRQGELFALRWTDVDCSRTACGFGANYVHGRFGMPKSKRSARSIPLADQVARELELLFQASSYQGDEDLVFGHPHTGRPLDRSRTLKRFKAALARAGVREIRFHDLATRSVTAWPRPGCRSAPCRSGWATATTRPR